MSKILKNNTGSIVTIDDVGQQIPASGQITIDQQDYLLYAASGDVVTLVGDETITVNDGSYDLSISDGIDLIKGLFPSSIDANVTSDFSIMAASGELAGITRVSLTGYNNAISGSFETIGRHGAVYVFPTSADTLDVYSYDNSDTLTGTGARVIQITGLDANYDEISELVYMNGTSTVTTSASFLRVNQVLVVSVGSQGTNDGTIHVEHNGTVVGEISDKDGVSQSVVYTIPAGKTGYIYAGFLTIEKNRVKAEVTQITSGIAYKILIIETGDQGFTFNPPIPLPIPEKSDFCVNAKLNSGTGGVTAAFTLILKDN